MASAEGLRELLIADLALMRGLVKAHDVAAALMRTWSEDAGADRLLDELTRIARLDPSALRDVTTEADDLISQAKGSVQGAVSRRGGLDRSIHVALSDAGANLSSALTSIGAGARAPLRSLHADRYVDFEPAGEGGMGLVYLALDTELNREVAFKMVRPDGGRGGTTDSPTTPIRAPTPERDTPASAAFEELKARFLQEAWVTGGLEHPGIVPVYELGQTETGIPYYTMRFVRGQRTLRDAIDDVYVDEQRSGPKEVTRLPDDGRAPEPAAGLERRLALLEPFLKLADAVEYAHARGVIHRDLKPENVALGEFGEVVLLDWGLAKLEGREDVAASVWQDRVHDFREAADLRTRAGPLGTLGYMSPEAALGQIEQVAAQSDVYSLGVILFEILTGRLPFAFANYLELREKLQQESPLRAHEVDPTVPKGLSAICEEALAKEPDARPAGVSALARSVRTWQAEQATSRRIELLLQEADTALSAAGDLKGDDRVELAARALASVAQAERLRPEHDAIVSRRRRADTLRAEGVKQRVRESMRRLGAAVAVVMLLLGLGVTIWIADREAREAEDTRREAALRAYRLGREFALQGRHRAARDQLLEAGERGLDTPALRLLLKESLRHEAHVLTHPAEVSGATFSSGGDAVLTTCKDGRVRLWSTLGDEEPRTFESDGQARGAAWLSTEEILIAGEGGLEVYDARTGSRRRRIGDAKPISALALAPNKRWIASLATDGKVELRDLRSDPVTVVTLDTRSARITDLGFDPTSRFMHTTSEGMGTWVWVVGEGEPLFSVSRSRRVAFAPDGNRIAIIDERAVTQVFQLPEATRLQQFRHPSISTFVQGTSLSFTPDGSLLATAATHSTIHVWSVETGALRYELEHPDFAVGCIFLRDGEHLLTLCRDGVGRIWHVSASRVVAELVGHDGWAKGCRLDPTGRRCATVGHDNTVRIWPTPGAPVRWRVPENVVPEPALAFSRGRLLVADASATVLRDAQTREEIARAPGVGGTALALPGDHTIATMHNNEMVLLEPEDLSVRTRLRGHSGLLRTLGYTEDGALLVTGAEDDKARVWELPSGRLRGELPGHQGGVPILVVLPGTQRVVTGDSTGAFRVWDAARLTLEATLEAHSDRATGIGASPDGRRFATADWTGVVNVYDAASLRRVQTLRAPDQTMGPAGLAMLAFDARAERLLGASLGGRAFLWDLGTGQLEHTFVHGDPLTFAQFVYDDQVALTVGWDGVRLWDLDSGELLLRQEHRQALWAWVHPEEQLIVSTAFEGDTRAFEIGLETRPFAEIRRSLEESGGAEDLK
ncbi:MAG: protein kinase [Planctomycetota bacterium]|nr:protein kinase [Planctomycetota bacterium]